jgi:hypothetical protein
VTGGRGAPGEREGARGPETEEVAAVHASRITQAARGWAAGTSPPVPPPGRHEAQETRAGRGECGAPKRESRSQAEVQSPNGPREAPARRFVETPSRVSGVGFRALGPAGRTSPGGLEAVRSRHPRSEPAVSGEVSAVSRPRLPATTGGTAPETGENSRLTLGAGAGISPRHSEAHRPHRPAAGRRCSQRRCRRALLGVNANFNKPPTAGRQSWVFCCPRLPAGRPAK